ncbi:hypothetical protein VTK56DRAFT_3597 [Thermocarpiscus australiensis]
MLSSYVLYDAKSAKTPLTCDIPPTQQQLLEQMDRESIKKQQEFIHKHHTATGKSTQSHLKYRKKKHSLQGKTSETHAVR